MSIDDVMAKAVEAQRRKHVELDYPAAATPGRYQEAQDALRTAVETAIADAVAVERAKPDPILFDDFAVLQEVRKRGINKTAGAVSEVLDAVVRLIRARGQEKANV